MYSGMANWWAFFPLYMECRRGLTSPSVRLSVCLSNACIWQNRRKICPDFIPCERPFSLVFWEEEWLVRASPSILNFGSTGPRWSEIADFEPIIARSASAVLPTEKVRLRLIGSLLRALEMSLRWSSYVAPKSPKGAQKRKTAVFLLKLHFAWRKSATKFIRVKNVSGKVVGHSLA